MPDITFIDQPVTRKDLKMIAEQRFGDMVKAVVDIGNKTMAVGAELHADEEAYLLDKGSEQKNLWGINIYPDLSLPDALEFDSMINIRPSQNNTSRDVEDENLRAKIQEVITKLVSDLT